MLPARARRGPSRRAAALAGAAALLALASVLPAGAQDEGRPIVTAIDVRPLSPVEPVRGSDGLVHLAYELLISNLSDKPVDVREVEVIDPDDGNAVVATIDAETLAGTMRIFGAGTSPQIPAGSGATLFVDVTRGAGETVPARLEHRFITEVADTAGIGTVLRTDASGELQEFVGAPERVARRPAVVVAPPVRGNDWVVANACCATITAHRGATLPIDGTIHVPERYAIDLVRLDARGRLFEGDPHDNGSYPYAGDEVHAAAPGTVVAVRDGLDDQTPGQLAAASAAQDAGGNSVVVDIGSGRYAFYGHLRPGSIRVRTGDRVATGDVLGLLGNSGTGVVPHLDFHVMDGPSPLTSDGLPFELTTFTSRGALRNLAGVQAGTAVADVDHTVDPGRHRRELPLDLQVIGFPASGR
jgi:murein DD-endopeptidase MepM/ murein hydrolase activator NlpD